MKPPLHSGSLAHRLQQAAGRHPDELALITADQRYSFAALLEAARARSQGITAASAAPIVALAGTSAELALAAYGCALAGRAFWPLDPRTADIVWPAMHALAGNHAVRLEPLPAALSAAPPTAVPTWVAAGDLALIVSTSGSSGEPKAVMLSHGNLDSAARAANARLGLGPRDLWLDCLALNHIGGLAILWRAACAGAGVLLHEGFSLPSLAAALACQPVTHISLVPAMLARLVEAGIPSPASLRVALVGGGPLSLSLYRQARDAGWPIHPTWGMSETAAQVATHCPHDGPWQPGLAGRPLDGLHVSVDPDGRLCIRGPQVMRGYLNPTLEPGLGLEDGWLPSGDLGRLEGDAVFVQGRADDLLVSGGLKVHPTEVEAALAACPGVREAAVAGVPDATWGDLVVALVAGTVPPSTLDDWCRERLRPAALPRRIVSVDALPRLPGGKLDRQALRRLAQEATA
ncbi:MAG: AMP-binding protein [Dechloromonas sp.]|nr:AMP-binding protein [Dechloromonas sp.]